MKRGLAVFKILGSFLFLGLFVYVFFKFVPFNVDEFLAYHPIACLEYPQNKLNTFRESCSEYDLAIVPPNYLPLRSYKYVGSFHSLLYYPLFKIWPSPYSARCMGLLMLVLQAYLVFKIFNVGFFNSLMMLAVFLPYAFQHMVDTGPVAFQTTSIFLICYLAKQWAEKLAHGKKHSWLYAFAIGLVMFLSVWNKVFYFVLMPAIFSLTAYFLIINKQIWKAGIIKNFFRDVFLLFFVLGLLIFLLFHAVDRQGMPYYKIFSQETHVIPLSDLSQWWGHFQEIFKYFANPLLAAHRIFILNTDSFFTPSGVSLLFLFVLLLGFGLWRLRGRTPGAGFIVLNVFLFILTLLLMAQDKDVWAMHHLVLTLPFILLAVFYVLSQLGDKKIVLLFTLVFFLINLGLYYSLRSLRINGEETTNECAVSHGLVALNEALKPYSHDDVFVVVSWGLYYFKSLYGNRDQCVLYIDLPPIKYFNSAQPFSSLNVLQSFEKIQRVTAKAHKKGVLFIGRNDMGEIFKGFKQLKFAFDTDPWVVWY